MEKLNPNAAIAAAEIDRNFTRENIRRKRCPEWYPASLSQQWVESGKCGRKPPGAIDLPRECGENQRCKSGHDAVCWRA